jgi:D-alanyl-D-alanine carboxypeptidase
LNVRAKTGTLLQDVSALSGWVWEKRAGQWAEFSVLSRGLPKYRAIAVEDRVVTIIAEHA